MPSAILITSFMLPHHLLSKDTTLVLWWIPADWLTSPQCYATIGSGYACYTSCQQSNKTCNSLYLNNILQISNELLSLSDFYVILCKKLIYQCSGPETPMKSPDCLATCIQAIQFLPKRSSLHWSSHTNFRTRLVPVECQSRTDSLQ